MLKPDVNKSMADFSTENGNIRFGLKFLTNAKTRANAVVESRESGFKSFKEFVQLRPGKQMAEACLYSGALDVFAKNNPDNRNSLLKAYNDLSDLHESIMKAKERIDNATKEDVRLKAEADYDALVDEWNAYDTFPDVTPMTLMERLTKEQEYTSIYFSGDPLDSYEIDIKDCKTIDSLEEGETAWVAAALSDDKILKTKKDALPMMSGRLTDKTGSMDMIIFPRAYEKVADSIQTVMAFQGTVKANGDEDVQFVVSDVKILPEKTKQIVVWFDDYRKTRELLLSGKVSKSEGMMAFLCGKNSKLYPVAYVTEEFVKENGLKYTIQ